MNNKQFMFIVIWISIASGIIGYQIGGIFLSIFAFVAMGGIFLFIGN